MSNLTGMHMLRLAVDWKLLEGTRGQDLADWDKFWDQHNTGSVQGNVHFQGDDLVLRALTAPEQLTAQHFRLRPDSAGYKAGKDGKDLGADVDLVGPGPAYERWKKTPDYQQWLEDCKQVTKAEAVKPKPRAFAVKDDAARKELAKWQGEWECSDHGKLIIKGERWTWHPAKGPEVVSTLKIVEVTDKMTYVLLLKTSPTGHARTHGRSGTFSSAPFAEDRISRTTYFHHKQPTPVATDRAPHAIRQYPAATPR